MESLSSTGDCSGLCDLDLPFSETQALKMSKKKTCIRSEGLILNTHQKIAWCLGQKEEAMRTKMARAEDTKD